MNHEFDSISRLFQQRATFQHPSTVLGNGDDASTHKIPDSFELVVSTDTAVSGVHWPLDMPLDIAANRAVQAALSDLAAMGAEPAWVWLAVMAQDSESLQKMSDGIIQACQAHQVELAGGDTVKSPTNTINVTVGGLVPQGLAMSRSAAKIGDEVWLIGELGLSAAGLQQWLSGNTEGDCVPYFQKIAPKIQQGLLLRKEGIRCCIDVSDGLLQDAGHIAKASQVSLVIELEKICALPSYQQLQESSLFDALELTLNGGEDYVLLCTAPAEKHTKLSGIGAHHIGHCTSGDHVQLTENGTKTPYQIKGYDHFD